MLTQMITRHITPGEKTFYEILGKHYAERIANEKRISAKRILRPRLQNIKKILSDNAINSCICEQ